MTRRLAVYLAALAICLALCVLFTVRGARREASAVFVDLPYPGAPTEQPVDPPLFSPGGPADLEVVRIEAGADPLAVMRDGRGVQITVRTGDVLEGGTVAAITQDAVVWESPKGTLLLKPPPGVEQ